MLRNLYNTVAARKSWIVCYWRVQRFRIVNFSMIWDIHVHTDILVFKQCIFIVLPFSGTDNLFCLSVADITVIKTRLIRLLTQTSNWWLQTLLIGLRRYVCIRMKFLTVNAVKFFSFPFCLFTHMYSTTYAHTYVYKHTVDI